MKLSNLVFIVSDACNFNCSYCLQKKKNIHMKPSTIKKAVPFFYSFLEEKAKIIFYGGEPLLAFDNIKYTVSLFQEKDRKGKKNLKFSITTNGSLINDEILDFFNLHCFFVLLSFDGTQQDITRKPGTLVPTRELIKRIRGGAYPGIQLATNSVFIPGAIGGLSGALRDIIRCGVTEIEFSLDETQPWDETALITLEKELEGLREFLVRYYKENGIIPVVEFRPPKSPPKEGFLCSAGQDRMVITPKENVWGCLHFHAYLEDKEGSDEFRSYSFGGVDDFIKNYDTVYPRVLSTYSNLRQDFFFTDKQYCFLCSHVDQCKICPVYAAHRTSFIGKIPPWMCDLKRILRKEKQKFFNEIKA